MYRYLALLLPVAALSTACGSSELTSWQLADEPASSDTTLDVVVMVGGCDEFARFDVRETEESTVTVSAYVNDGAKTNCDDVINLEERTVELRRPLGERVLEGCNPQSALYGAFDRSASNDDCRSSVR